MEAVYKAFERFPENVKYFKKYFDHPESIAKYSIMKIIGGMCCITSAAAEQYHSSNDVARPTKIMGIVSPEQQLLEMLRWSDDWIQRDLTEIPELELFQIRKSHKLHDGCPEHKAIMALIMYYFPDFFSRNTNV